MHVTIIRANPYAGRRQPQQLASRASRTENTRRKCEGRKRFITTTLEAARHVPLETWRDSSRDSHREGRLKERTSRLSTQRDEAGIVVVNWTQHTPPVAKHHSGFHFLASGLLTQDSHYRRREQRLLSSRVPSWQSLLLVSRANLPLKRLSFRCGSRSGTA